MEPTTSPITLPSTAAVEAELATAKSMEDFFGHEGIFARLFSKTMEQMLAAELEQHLGYKKHDKKGVGSGNSHNGTYTRKLKTSTGEVELSVPRDRAGSFEPQVLPRYETRTNEFEDKIIALYSHGTTTADIVTFVYDTYGMSISKEQVSTITDKILPEVTEWQNRTLEAVYPIVYLDCIHIKLRTEGRIVTTAVYCALGIDLTGKKEVLGHWIGTGGEGAKFWLSVVTNLQSRGVQDILIACVDGLTGFKEAIMAVFPRTTVQRCIIHQVRNTLKYINSGDEDRFILDLQSVYKAPSREAAWTAFEQLKATWGKSYGAALSGWEEHWIDLTTYFDYPEELRRIIYTTNTIESYNRQLRKVTKAKSVFPTENSLLKMLYLATQNATKKWTASVPNWGKVMCQLSIIFEGRLPL